jgi:hypothetical protein
MARALRLEFEDALYHLNARGQETVNFLQNTPRAHSPMR